MATDAILPDFAAAPPALAPSPACSPRDNWIDWTLSDLQAHLGGIPLERIRLHPPPGTASKENAEEVHARTKRTFELIDGVLVEKSVGFYESVLAAWIIRLIGKYLDANNVGIMAGEASTVEILPAQVRAADVCVIRWERFPGGKIHADPIPAVVPNLVVEVLSKSNTKVEMRRKLRDCFTAGVQLAWYIEPRMQTARAYTGEEQFVEVDSSGSLSGGDVLPGFNLSLVELFALANARPAADDATTA